MNDYQNRITIITDALPIIWDLHLTNDYAGKIIFGPLSLPLFLYNKKSNNFEKIACDDYVVSNSGKEHSFTVKEGLKWSNGIPITAKDYYQTFEKIIKSKAPLSFLLRHVQDFSTFSKSDKSRGIICSNNMLTFKLTRPDFDFYKLMSMINFSPYSIHSGPNVSAGPFVLHKQSDRKISYKRNPFYSIFEHHNEELVFHKESDRYNGIELYNTNRADITCNTMFPFENIECYSGNPEFHSSTLDIIGYLAFNEKSSIFHHACLRLGLIKLINREIIKAELLEGVSIANDFFTHTEQDLCNSDTLFDYNEGLKLVKRYLDEKKISRFTIKCAYDDFYPNLKIIENIHNQLKTINIDIEIVKDDYYRPNPQRYDMKFVLSPLLYKSDLANYQLMGFSTFLREKLSDFRNYYSLINAYSSTQDITSKKNIAIDVNNLILQNSVAIPLIKLKSFYFKKTNIKGFSYCKNESDFRYIIRT